MVLQQLTSLRQMLWVENTANTSKDQDDISTEVQDGLKVDGTRVFNLPFYIVIKLRINRRCLEPITCRVLCLIYNFSMGPCST